MPTITYNGVSMESIEENELTQEQFEQLKKQYYEKPSRKELINEIATLISMKGTKMSVITNYYFKDLMAKTKIYFNKWTIEDCFNHKPLLDRFYSKTLKNKKVFTSDKLIDNIETAFRLGGKGVASKVANFPLATMDEIFKRYNVNNNYYDMSCGWGARLTASLKNKVNYFGTDPNYLLVDRLNQLVKDWKEITYTNPKVDIRCQGSEIFNQDWVNKMGLCFTSPPYFNLEDYKIGNQSYKDGMNYQQWLDVFLEPTIKNCYNYLIDNGYFGINVKDFNGYKLVEDTQNIAERNGFTLVEKMQLENISRCNSLGDFNDTNEIVMIFMKNEFKDSHKPYVKPTQINIFDLI